MWIKPLRSMVGSYGKVRRGVPANVEKHLADRLIAKGLAVPHAGAAAKPEGGEGRENPPKATHRGGKTGKAKLSRSSRAGQASPISR